MDDHRPDSIFSTSSRLKKYMVSFAIYYCNFVQGICATFLSPLVLDFSHKFNSTVDQVSMVFSVILVSYLVSALLCTIIFKFVNRQLVLIFLLALVAAAFFTIPYTNTVIQFFIFSSLIGFGSGGYDTAQVAWIIDIWRSESPPFILTQHFTYSVGTLVPPLLLGPFLRNKNGTTNGTMNGTDFFNDTTESPADLPILPTNESALIIPFSVAGVLSVCTVLVQIALYFAFKSMKAPAPVAPVVINHEEVEAEPGTSEESRERENISVPQDSFKRKACLVGLACCFIGFYAALELCTQQFLPTFTHFSEIKLTETEGARILFGLQLGFSIGRLVGIGLVLKIAPHFILAGNLLILVVSNTILLVLGGSDVEWLWVGSVMIGVGMSTVYPSLYAYIEKYIFVTESVAGIITVAGGLVPSIYPLIVGNAVQTHPQILTYVNYVSISVCSCSFATIFWLTYCKSCRRYKKLT